MTNRVRMLVASFLVKDLHVEWQAPAPTRRRTPDLRPDHAGGALRPAGDYVRRWVPELHDGSKEAYPESIVDHAEQRALALAAYEELCRR